MGKRAGALGLLTWMLTWAALLALDPRLDLANLALLLVLGAMAAALWWPPRWALPAAALAVAAFNWAFVPPRHSFNVDLHQHALLLAALLAASWLVSALVARQRRLAELAQAHARRSEQLRELAEALRDGAGPVALITALQPLARGPVSLWLPPGEWLGAVDANTRSGLTQCAQQARAFGPGCGHHEEEDGWYLPLRGREACAGAAHLPLANHPGERPVLASNDDRVQAQALCDQLGLALERSTALAQAQAAQEEAASQRLRNTLLAAIAHDHRTPLATILGAASSLRDQGERLDATQRQRLAAQIVQEAEHLARVTDNGLQLTRLGEPGLSLNLDWESAEELVGSVLERLRLRDPQQRIKVYLAPGLPLLRCDAVLIVQLLDNLLDNALRHGGGGAIELRGRLHGSWLQLAVRDRGPGVPPGQRERIFQPYQRGEHAGGRSTGVGLALCRAIARAHGGELRHRARGHGGSSFELELPVQEQAPP